MVDGWDYINDATWQSKDAKYRIAVNISGCFVLCRGQFDDNDEWQTVEREGEYQAFHQAIEDWKILSSASKEKQLVEIEQELMDIHVRCPLPWKSLVRVAAEKILELREANA